MLGNILAFVAVFGIIVIVHEFGHFYFAKRAGILVREFSIGFGPKLFHYRKGETTYTIRLIPAGGYVLMAGFEEEQDLRPGMALTLLLDEEDKVERILLSDKEDHFDGVPMEVTNFNLDDDLYIAGRVVGNEEVVERYEVKRDAIVVQKDGTELQIAPIERRFQSAPLISRIMTNFAGPMNNFILAILTFILLAFIQGGVPTDEPRAGDVQEGSVAADAGIEAGNTIYSIDETPVESWNEMVAIIQENPDEEITVEFESSAGERVEATLIPEAYEVEEGTVIGRIGIQSYLDDSIGAQIAYGFTESWYVITNIFNVLRDIVTGQFAQGQLGGPVAIYATTEQVVETAGVVGIISLIAYLSVNLGIMNLLPIPALDGGKLVLNIIEGVRGKPLSQEKEMIITLIGAVFLIALMIFVTWNDIQQFFF